jgi:hypothetical protein
VILPADSTCSNFLRQARTKLMISEHILVFSGLGECIKRPQTRIKLASNFSSGFILGESLRTTLNEPLV